LDGRPPMTRRRERLDLDAQADREPPVAWAVVCAAPALDAGLWLWRGGWLVLAVYESRHEARAARKRHNREGLAVRILAFPARIIARPNDLIGRSMADAYAWSDRP
jgi:hypothetical protein